MGAHDSPPPLPPSRSARSTLRMEREATLQHHGPGASQQASDHNKTVIITVLCSMLLLLVLVLILVIGAGVGVGVSMLSNNGFGKSDTDLSAASESRSNSDFSEPAAPYSPTSPKGAGKDDPKADGDPKNGTDLKQDDEPNADSPGSSSPPPSVSGSTPAPPAGAEPKTSGEPPATSGSNGSDTSSASSGQPPAGKKYSVSAGSFFGIQPEGKSVVYVIDCSGSMAGGPLDRARTELIRSISSLKSDQAYYVIFFADSSFPMYAPKEQASLAPATPENLEKLKKWIVNFSASGGTEPRDALTRALALRPASIVFLTDGGFDSAIVQQIHQANVHKVAINTIAFIRREGEVLLKLIADQNDGQYLFVP